MSAKMQRLRSSLTKNGTSANEEQPICQTGLPSSQPSAGGINIEEFRRGRSRRVTSDRATKDFEVLQKGKQTGVANMGANTEQNPQKNKRKNVLPPRLLKPVAVYPGVAGFRTSSISVDNYKRGRSKREVTGGMALLDFGRISPIAPLTRGTRLASQRDPLAIPEFSELEETHTIDGSSDLRGSVQAFPATEDDPFTSVSQGQLPSQQPTVSRVLSSKKTDDSGGDRGGSQTPRPTQDAVGKQPAPPKGVSRHHPATFGSRTAGQPAARRFSSTMVGEVEDSLHELSEANVRSPGVDTRISPSSLKRSAVDTGGTPSAKRLASLRDEFAQLADDTAEKKGEKSGNEPASSPRRRSSRRITDSGRPPPTESPGESRTRSRQSLGARSGSMSSGDASPPPHTASRRASAYRAAAAPQVVSITPVISAGPRRGSAATAAGAAATRSPGPQMSSTAPVGSPARKRRSAAARNITVSPIEKEQLREPSARQSSSRGQSMTVESPTRRGSISVSRVPAAGRRTSPRRSGVSKNRAVDEALVETSTSSRASRRSVQRRVPREDEAAADVEPETAAPDSDNDPDADNDNQRSDEEKHSEEEEEISNRGHSEASRVCGNSSYVVADKSGRSITSEVIPETQADVVEVEAPELVGGRPEEEGEESEEGESEGDEGEGSDAGDEGQDADGAPGIEVEDGGDEGQEIQGADGSESEGPGAGDEGPEVQGADGSESEGSGAGDEENAVEGADGILGKGSDRGDEEHAIEGADGSGGEVSDGGVEGQAVEDADGSESEGSGGRDEGHAIEGADGSESEGSGGRDEGQAVEGADGRDGEGSGEPQTEQGQHVTPMTGADDETSRLASVPANKSVRFPEEQHPPRSKATPNHGLVDTPLAPKSHVSQRARRLTVASGQSAEGDAPVVSPDNPEPGTSAGGAAAGSRKRKPPGEPMVMSLWQGEDGVRRGTRDVCPLDVLLSTFEDVAWDLRERADDPVCRKAIGIVASKTQKELRAQIEEQTRVRQLDGRIRAEERLLRRKQADLIALKKARREAKADLREYETERGEIDKMRHLEELDRFIGTMERASDVSPEKAQPAGRKLHQEYVTYT